MRFLQENGGVFGILSHTYDGAYHYHLRVWLKWVFINKDRRRIFQAYYWLKWYKLGLSLSVSWSRQKYVTLRKFAILRETRSVKYLVLIFRMVIIKFRAFLKYFKILSENLLELNVKRFYGHTFPIKKTIDQNWQGRRREMGEFLKVATSYKQYALCHNVKTSTLLQHWICDIKFTTVSQR